MKSTLFCICRTRLYKRKCDRPLSLFGLRWGTLAAHHTSASPVAATNTNQALSEASDLMFRASVTAERGTIQRTTMACKMEQLAPLTVSWKVKHLPYCLVCFFTQRKQRNGMERWNTANSGALVPSLSAGIKHRWPVWLLGRYVRNWELKSITWMSLKRTTSQAKWLAATVHIYINKDYILWLVVVC